MKEMEGIAKNLTQRKDGIWVSGDMANVSYPSQGNADCYKVEDGSFWFKHRNDCILEAIKKFPPPGAIYDIGGGNGYVALGIKNSGYEVVLVEPGIEGAHNALSRGLSPVICSSLEGAGFFKGSMPSVGIFDVLEHIEDDRAFLKKIKEFLMPGGTLYLTVPAYGFLWSVEDDSAGHYRRYTLKNLTESLRSVGFKVEYSTYYFALLLLPILLFRVIPGKVGLRKKSSSAYINREHSIDNKALDRVLRIYLQLERYMVRKGGIMPGSSCLVVARAEKGVGDEAECAVKVDEAGR